MQVKKSSKLKRLLLNKVHQFKPRLCTYREVDLTCPHTILRTLNLRQILNLPDPRDIMPRSSTTVWALNDVAGQQELRPRGPSAMLPLSPQLKDVFDKFKQDFQATNLPENKSIKSLVPLGVLL